MKRWLLVALIAAIGVLLAACSATPSAQPVATPALPPAATVAPATEAPSTAAPAATKDPTATEAPAPTEAPSTAAPATEAPAPSAKPDAPAGTDPETGHQVWLSKPCAGCHGANAEGATGPRLAGTGLTFDAVLLRVRTGKGPMPAFTTAQVSDQELQQIYAWLQSAPGASAAAAPTTAPTAVPTGAPVGTPTAQAAAPTAAPATAAPQATSAPAPVAFQPTPLPPPNYPTGALNAFWSTVNDLKVKSDFTKDLPARQAQDEAGRLSILKGYAGEAVGLGQQAIGQGNQALGEVTNGTVKADLQQALNAVQQIVDQANQAQGRGTYAEAYQNASEMARLSRIEAWPWATQAVRDAGLTGSVRVLVTNQAGRPLAGAFVTVLTAHDPAAALTDANGRATILNAAAVPALQVKAYAPGMIYHEEHANLAPGATADVTIALPSANPSGQSPSVSGVEISPAAGSGSAAIVMRMTAADPQGRADLAEDQLFALNPALGAAHVLQSVGGNGYSSQLQLPGLPAGPQTWYFFAVDHECNTSNVVSAKYVVQ